MQPTDKNSIVDTLKSQGKASDFASRTTLAKEMGIANYAGTADQNMQLLKLMGNQTNVGTAGAPLMVPTGSAADKLIKSQSGVMQTTKQIGSTDNQNISNLNTKVNGGVVDNSQIQPGGGTPNAPGGNNNPTPGANNATTGGYMDTAPTGFEYNLPPLEDPKSKRVYDATGNVFIQDSTGKVTVDPVGQAEYQKQKAKQKEIDDLNTRYDTYKKGLDTSHQQLIDSIKASAQVQRQKMEELNKKTLGMRKVQGFRTPGVAEYTSELYTGILKKEEADGIQRLGEIDANMNLLIAQAVQSKNAQDFELLNKQMSAINNLQQQKETAVQNIYENSMKNAKFIQDKLKQADDMARAQADQALQNLKVQAPGLVSKYDALKTQAEKTAYLDVMAKKTGLDIETILGQIESSRLDIKEKNVDIEKKQKEATSVGSGGAKQNNVSAFYNDVVDYKGRKAEIGKKGSGDFFYDTNGFITPTGLKIALADAVGRGISRSDAIESLVGELYLENGFLPQGYMDILTPKERKIIEG